LPSFSCLRRRDKSDTLYARTPTIVLTYKWLRAVFRAARHLHKPTEFSIEAGDEDTVFEDAARCLAEAERQVVQGEQRVVEKERRQTEKECQEAKLKREAVEAQQNVLVAQRNSIVAGRNLVQAERNVVQAERNLLQAERDLFEAKRNLARWDIAYAYMMAFGFGALAIGVSPTVCVLVPGLLLYALVVSLSLYIR
jgi:hypothetical protein